jgi:hypothetical protein
MKVALRRNEGSSRWVLQVLERAHNHGPSVAAIAHPAHRIPALTPDQYAQINTLAQAELSSGRILVTLRASDPEIPLLAKDISNIIQQKKAQELDGQTPIQWLVKVRIILFLGGFTNIYSRFKELYNPG